MCERGPRILLAVPQLSHWLIKVNPSKELCCDFMASCNTDLALGSCFKTSTIFFHLGISMLTG